MPRPLSELQTQTVDDTDEQRDLAMTRRTSRSFAAAVAVLLLATLVTNRTGSALTRTPANAGAGVVAGVIELGDDDEGQSLFDLDALSPTTPVERCIEVDYSGTILPVELRMRAEADGALGEYLDVVIEVGTGGSYESCEGFVTDDDLFAGTLDELVANEWTDVGRFFNRGERRTFRISLELQDRSEALGQSTSLGLAWEAVPA